MLCVSNVTNSVMLNGQPGGIIEPSSGIQQGNPISAYLYLLCAEGLSSLINYAKMAERINGFKVARGSIPITHLFFVEKIAYLFARQPLLSGYLFKFA